MCTAPRRPDEDPYGNVLLSWAPTLFDVVLVKRLATEMTPDENENETDDGSPAKKPKMTPKRDMLMEFAAKLEGLQQRAVGEKIDDAMDRVRGTDHAVLLSVLLPEVQSRALDWRCGLPAKAGAMFQFTGDSPIPLAFRDIGGVSLVLTRFDVNGALELFVVVENNTPVSKFVTESKEFKHKDQDEDDEW